MSIAENISKFNQEIAPFNAQLIAVSKTKPNEDLLQAYEANQRDLGENKVQELTRKHEELPKDIRWHMIGHLQRNKVKYIAPFVHLIHAVDSLRLLVEINKQAEKNERVINCLLQVYIAKEESKFGLDEKELEELLNSDQFAELNNIKVVGLMGMATNTDNEEVVRKEFKSLKALFEELKNKYNSDKIELKELSMGMTGDYKIALEEGSTMIRVGSAIFGSRNYQ
ncbi:MULTISPECIES: YggS family pyridoxal phosphate-dependent enzyme [Roseivirga]|uniref:Pyridoxal phosphate homeostasis protein n=1 Tax=Roseivirga spongicola TaxID=333140 RepID=A0A150XAJ0_9BACT|nr:MULTISPECIES: YggS family pyridoxal phosphate-dependent enzyme [Roseivirga]KYG75694.1 alanine racemase [Roseivirga spongicola]MBO6662460.1 YggS family pyridoxal phosphate-dependent enzyme [Roseivirga sp.]MBO6762175.1 YggS family pyridoxal phosphate-dependent enzyme [Roseivirga sp.]MBO6909976.1 YggS family pyridoxal phosphate-dependent enzyme [Roseivirga sp.]WPZ10742.1 YggS family pyridoxal phosphate-dependent enzyme [Roseivirga spongicola]